MLLEFKHFKNQVTTSIDRPCKRFSSFICRRWQKNFSQIKPEHVWHLLWHAWYVVGPPLEKLWRPGQSAGPLGTVSGTGFLAADALDPVDCRLGPPWMWLQGISWMLNYVEIWKFWKLDQILELFIVLNSFSQVSFWGVAGALSCYVSGIMTGMWRCKTDIHMSSRAQNFPAEQFIEYDQCYSLQLSAILMLLIDQRPFSPKGTKNFTWFSGAGKWQIYWSRYLFF